MFTHILGRRSFVGLGFFQFLLLAPSFLSLSLKNSVSLEGGFVAPCLFFACDPRGGVNLQSWLEERREVGIIRSIELERADVCVT
jgi:hypothetical protein